MKIIEAKDLFITASIILVVAGIFTENITNLILLGIFLVLVGIYLQLDLKNDIFIIEKHPGIGGGSKVNEDGGSETAEQTRKD